MVATTAGRPPQGLIGYLRNVTIRSGYRFASPEEAVAHGEDICTPHREGQPSSGVVSEVKTDLGAADDYLASNVIAQAVQDIYPVLTWRLRGSGPALSAHTSTRSDTTLRQLPVSPGQ
jgi:hypothetical protein